MLTHPPFRRMNRFCIVFPALLAILAASCNRGPASGRVLREAEFVDAYVALLDLEAANAPRRVDSLAIDSTLGTLGVTREQMRRTAEANAREPKRWESFYAAVVKKLEAREKKPDSTAAAPKPGG